MSISASKLRRLCSIVLEKFNLNSLIYAQFMKKHRSIVYAFCNNRFVKKTSLFGKNIIFKLARLLLKKPKDTKSISNKCHWVSNMTNKAIQRFTKIWSGNLEYKKHCQDWLNKFAFSHKWWLSKRINIKIQALEQVCALSVQPSVLSLQLAL